MKSWFNKHATQSRFNQPTNMENPDNKYKGSIIDNDGPKLHDKFTKENNINHGAKNMNKGYGPEVPSGPPMYGEEKPGGPPMMSKGPRVVPPDDTDVNNPASKTDGKEFIGSAPSVNTMAKTLRKAANSSWTRDKISQNRESTPEGDASRRIQKGEITAKTAKFAANTIKKNPKILLGDKNHEKSTTQTAANFFNKKRSKKRQEIVDRQIGA